ncbi:MAG: hypothetical protein AB1486_03525 [Planctomycetota bacterium]
MPRAQVAAALVLFAMGPVLTAQDEIWFWQGDGRFFGASVAGAGDTDGDGHAGVLVGDYGWESTRGKVTLFSGATGEILRSWRGEAGWQGLGRQVAGIGDVDGDGLADIAFSAFWRREEAGDYVGRVYAYSGASGELVLDRETPWGKNPPFQPPSFPLAKDPRAFRIFCLGDSTVNGTPFSRHSSFANWLRVRLEQLHPARRFEVVRMAADARATREVAELCREVVHYAPDLVIVYTGHNEFLFKNLPPVRNPLRFRLHELARDRDNHPNRATARHLQLIDEIAPPFAVIADCQSVFDSASATGVAGNDLLVDNVHPDLDAQNLIAEAVLRAMATAGLLAPESAWRFEEEPDVGEYRRRMGLDLREIATSFTEYAFSNLVRVYGQKESADPLSATERLLRFALRYDSENASAPFSLAIVHALRGETEGAREHLERSRRGDPGIVTAFLGMARRNSSLAPMANRLQELLAEGGGK